MTTVRDPQKKKRAPSKGRVLLWAGVFLFEFRFAHQRRFPWRQAPQAGPLTAERLARLPYFEGCELLDVHTRAGGSARLFGQSDADWVLYRNSAGETAPCGRQLEPLHLPLSHRRKNRRRRSRRQALSHRSGSERFRPVCRSPFRRRTGSWTRAALPECRAPKAAYGSIFPLRWA